MSDAGTYVTTYHREDYTLADAFRPQPGWGMRRFTVDVSVLGEHTEDEFIEAARTGAPDRRYRLTSVSIIEPGKGERVLWSTPADQRFAPVATGAQHE